MSDAKASAKIDRNNNKNDSKAAEVNEDAAPPQLGRFDQQMLDAHNAYREHHEAPPLKYNAVLSKRAQYWANSLAEKNSMCHENQDWDGENLAMKWSSEGTNFPATDFVNMWYYEGQNYKFPGTQLGAQNNENCVTGHFSQVVWKSTREVGFGRAVSKTGRVFVVARYRPPGNVIGYYKANVLPPKEGQLRRRYQP